MASKTRQRISTDKDCEKVARAAIKRGWQVARRGRHTMLLWPANGARVVVPVSPGGGRTVANLSADLARAEAGQQRPRTGGI